jgi:predicted amidohydrolase
METLTIQLIQSRVQWHDPADNRSRFEAEIDGLEPWADLIVLPETFDSGFTRSPQVCAEGMDGQSVVWMQHQAARTGAVLTGSLAINDQGSFYNRLIWATPDGQLQWYDKRHLFSMGGENERYSAGKHRAVFAYRGWRICPQVCYDLRFPVWSRNRNDYDLLLYVANWPTPRAHAWRTLLRARANENQCYVVGLNRVGRDGNHWDYAGDSAIIDFLGHPLAEIGDQEGHIQASLDAGALADFRREFPFDADADSFELGAGDSPSKRHCG